MDWTWKKLQTSAQNPEALQLSKLSSLQKSLPQLVSICCKRSLPQFGKPFGNLFTCTTLTTQNLLTYEALVPWCLGLSPKFRAFGQVYRGRVVFPQICWYFVSWVSDCSTARSTSTKMAQHRRIGSCPNILFFCTFCWDRHGHGTCTSSTWPWNHPYTTPCTCVCVRTRSELEAK